MHVSIGIYALSNASSRFLNHFDKHFIGLIGVGYCIHGLFGSVFNVAFGEFHKDYQINCMPLSSHLYCKHGFLYIKIMVLNFIN